MKIISNKKYNYMVEKYETEIETLENQLASLETTIQVKDKNYEHQENIKKILDKNLKKANEEICNLKIQLEDIHAYLEQERQVSTQLRKERSYLRGLLTKNNIKYRKEEKRSKNENK